MTGEPTFENMCKAMDALLKSGHTEKIIKKIRSFEHSEKSPRWLDCYKNNYGADF